jgi:hypothetical protein
MVAYNDDNEIISCPTEPMVPLTTDVGSTEHPEFVQDKISRRYFFYEEKRANRTISKITGKVHTTELKILRERAPDPTTNHAGEKVGLANYEPEADEIELWEVTLGEVTNVEWSMRNEGIMDDEVSWYKVVGLRRWKRQRTFAIVATRDEDTQLDHHIREIRDKAYHCLVVSKFKKALPHFLQWQHLMDSRFAYDFRVMQDNAISYDDAL